MVESTNKLKIITDLIYKILVHEIINANKTLLNLLITVNLITFGVKLTKISIKHVFLRKLIFMETKRDIKKKNKNYILKTLKALIYSSEGLASAIKEERAFQLELLLLLFSMFLMFIVETSLFEKFLMIFISLLILIVELINSSIEATVDRISLEYNNLSKKAKDYGSAAVFITIILWLFIHVYILILS